MPSVVAYHASVIITRMGIRWRLSCDFPDFVSDDEFLDGIVAVLGCGNRMNIIDALSNDCSAVGRLLAAGYSGFAFVNVGV